jgi:hypothetical protein
VKLAFSPGPATNFGCLKSATAAGSGPSTLLSAVLSPTRGLFQTIFHVVPLSSMR